MSFYPNPPADRDRWILARRSSRPSLDPWKPHAFLLETEPSASGTLDPVATVFLTNRECPWRCLMCDLWKNTLRESVPPGAIPTQIDHALQQLQRQASLPSSLPKVIKLYNSGSFFDPRAIPTRDLPAIARRLRDFRRLIVECHPSLVDDRVLRFRDLLHREGGPSLELALGLETAHPEILEKLNKRMTLDCFSRAARFLRVHGLDLRVFILVQPPFMKASESVAWAEKSAALAFAEAASAISLIPTRMGNGALEALAAEGLFGPPTLATLEAAVEAGLNLNQGRVFADLWDLEVFSECSDCFPLRKDRLHKMNLAQSILPGATCRTCGHGG